MKALTFKSVNAFKFEAKVNVVNQKFKYLIN